MRTSREVIDDVARTHPSIHCAVIDLFFADGSSALNVSTVIKMVLSQFCRGRFRLSSSLSCEAPFCLPRTGPAALACNMCCLSRRRPTLSLRHTLSQETRSSVRREKTISRRGHNKIPLGSAAPRYQGSAARSHQGALS